MPLAECQAIMQGLFNNPITFLSQNIIYVNMQQEGPPTQRLRRFEAVPQGIPPIGAGGNPGGGEMYSVYDDDDGPMLAYYLPWDMDAGYYIQLSRHSAVRLMFTAALSGCAVGVVWGADGSARVSHHNIQGPGGTNDQAQRTSLSFAHAALHRTRYRVAGTIGNTNVMASGMAHVHGVRHRNGAWHFYVQVIRRYTTSMGAVAWVIAEVGELT